MKNQLFTAVLIFVSAATFAQVVREEGRGIIVITPSLAHNLSQVRVSSEAGLTVGVEAINNQSTFSIGYNFRHYYFGDVKNPGFHAISLSSAVYPFANFGLGFVAQSDLRRGDYLNEKVTIGENILDECGEIIGKLDDTRGSSVRTKIFGSIGVIFKVDNNFKIESLLMFKDYAPNRWFDPVSTDPFNHYPVKVRMAYSIPVFKLK